MICTAFELNVDEVILLTSQIIFLQKIFLSGRYHLIAKMTAMQTLLTNVCRPVNCVATILVIAVRTVASVDVQ